PERDGVQPWLGPTRRREHRRGGTGRGGAPSRPRGATSFPSGPEVSPDARRRFARQQLLPEVGPEGQARLSAHRFSAGDDRASEVAALYLERAGARRVVDARALPVSAAGLTADPALAEAAAFLAG